LNYARESTTRMVFVFRLDRHLSVSAAATSIDTAVAIQSSSRT